MKLKFIDHHPPTRDGHDMTFVAVFRWSPTCLLKEKRVTNCLFTEGTIRNVPNEFTLHSLAPAFGGIYTKSTRQEKEHGGDVDFKQFPEGMRGRLVKIWPDLFGGNHENFWGKQWRGHGVQAGMEPNDYFQIPIYICQKIGILGILKEDGIYPDSEIYPEDVLDCLAKKLDTTPELYSYFGSKNQYLHEILIRFDLNLKPIPRDIQNFGVAGEDEKDRKSQGNEGAPLNTLRGNFDPSSPIIFKTMSKLLKYM